MTRNSHVLALVLFLSTTAAIAQNGPDNDADQAPGYVDNVFHHNQVDSINLYNGQVTLPISLGPSYPIGSKLKFQMMLTYNSKVWSYGKPRATITNFQFQPLTGDPALGIGWSLMLGAIRPCKVGLTSGQCYFAPDGSQHLFPISTGGSVAAADGTQFFLHDMGTNGPYEMWDGDGNRYYFGQPVSGYNDTLNNPVKPDPGYVHDFGYDRDGYYLTQVSEPFLDANNVPLNKYTVTYQTLSPCWSYYSDSTHTCNVTQMDCTGTGSWIPKQIVLPTGTITIALDANNMISTVSFPVPGNNPAVWTFHYLAPEYAGTRPCNDVNNPIQTSVWSGVHIRELHSLDLPSSIGSWTFDYTQGGHDFEGLLDKVTLPTGGTIEYCYGGYIFFHGKVGAVANGCGALPPDSSEDVVVSGNGTCITHAPQPGPPPEASADCNASNEARWKDSSWGVQVRTETDTITGTVGVTKYSQYAFPWGEQGQYSASNPPPSQTLTIVTYPPDVDGSQHWKGVLFNSSPIGFLGVYPGDRIGADIEERDYTSNPLAGPIPTSPACTGSSSPTNLFCADHAVRVTKRTYEYQLASETFNRHLQSEQTYYGAMRADRTCPTSCPRYKQVTFGPTNSYTTWDNNGRHYATETHTDNFASPVTRTITTTWRQLTPLPADPVWTVSHLPNILRKRVTAEGSYSLDERYYFDLTTGFLRGRAIYDVNYNQTPWVHCRFPDSYGNPVNDFTATIAGFGDPGSTPCSVYSSWSVYVAQKAFGNSDAFGRERTFSNGEILTSRWWDGSPNYLPPGDPNSSQTPMSWYAHNYGRDPETGWITSSADPAGQSTGYAYDSIGRVTQVSPPGETAINVSYDDANTTTVSRGTLAWERYRYDGLGRLIREIKQTDTSSYAVQTHAYDASGREYFASVWAACTSVSNCDATNPAGTTQSAFDPFGRPQKIVGPANATYNSFNRTDDSVSPSAPFSDTKEQSTTCVGGIFDGSGCSPSTSAATTRTYKDVLGRITKVTLPDLFDTRYAWDVNDKLRCVMQGGTGSLSTCNANSGNEWRSFSYNMFGYLTQEVTPEKGTVSYTYGSIGNVRNMTEGVSPNQHIVNYAYDGAGRLVTETLASGQQYTLNCYDGTLTSGTTCEDGSANSNGGSNAPGKLTRRIGTNPDFVPLYLPPPETVATERVREDFSYGGVGGRVSDKTTTILGSTGLTIGAVSGATEHWDYSPIGLVTTYKHPRVRGLFQENRAYSYGRLTGITFTGTEYDNSAIPGMTITTTFQPAGNLKSYQVQQTGFDPDTFTIEQDASGLPRPLSFHDSGGWVNSEGSYSYDAAGNVLSIGNTIYAYDSRSRVISMYRSDWPNQTCTDAAGTPNRSQCQNYDQWDNLISVAGYNPRSLSVVTSPSRNNRLSAASYDAWGNLTDFGGEHLDWDDVNRQIRDKTSSNTIVWQYIYGGADERLARIPAAASSLSVTRREMARYIVQGKPFTPAAPCSASTFTDVTCADPDSGYIETLAATQITAGCGGNLYCPESPVTRAQMAVFLLKAEHGTLWTPRPCSPQTHIFADVPCPSQYADWIGELYAEGITGGCDGSNDYCPTANVTELQMSTFMSKGASQTGPGLWPPYKPISGGSYYTVRDASNQIATQFTDSFPKRENIYIGSSPILSYQDKQPGVSPRWEVNTLDHLHTIRWVNQTTQYFYLIDSFQYWPYGDRMGGTTAGDQPVAFGAMERDAENSHYYDHARVDDFNLGRFVSPDVLAGKAADPQSWNRYSYARSNPVALIDSDGREFGRPASATTTEQQDLQQVLVSQALARGDEVCTRCGVGGALIPLPTRGLEPSAIAIEDFAAGAIAGLFKGLATRSALEFTQDSIRATFRNGEFAGQTIEAVTDGLKSGAIKAEQLPVDVVTRDGVNYALNSRSLVALEKAGVQPVIRNQTGVSKFEKILTNRLKELETKNLLPMGRKMPAIR